MSIGPLHSDADSVQNWPEWIARELMEIEWSFGAQMQLMDVENLIRYFFISEQVTMLNYDVIIPF